MSWSVGHKIQNGKYVIEKVLGQGGFGITYKALHIALNQQVVIKTPNNALKNDPNYAKFAKRFLREGQALAKLSKARHRHIVRVSDLFEEHGTPCLVMDFIEGENLFDLIHRKGRLTELEAVEYIRQIGSALILVHSEGLIHRDAHPGNIMILEPKEAVLIDFGISGEMQPTTVSSSHFGNMSFAPYEQFLGHREPTIDIYTLSASLYYALTGVIPPNFLERKLNGRELVSPHELMSSISERLSQAILAGMSLEAAERPQSIEEWLKLIGSSSVPLISQSGINYRLLDKFLANQRWEQADKITKRLMLKIAKEPYDSWLYSSVDDIPSQDLEIINSLWLKYSDGQFGFTVQKYIWKKTQKQLLAESQNCSDKNLVYKKFCEQVGWRIVSGCLLTSYLDYSLQAPLGHFPVRVIAQGRYGIDFMDKISMKEL